MNMVRELLLRFEFSSHFSLSGDVITGRAAHPTRPVDTELLFHIDSRRLLGLPARNPIHIRE